MILKALIPILALSIFVGLAAIVPCMAPAGEVASTSGYKVLAPIRHGNLTVFPVVAAASHDTQQFLTLDEGLHSGEVVVTESGSLQPLMRRRNYIPQGGAQVNQLVLVNNSKKPLILLAGEIVTGGKQDRVIGKDRLVPAESDPVDLSVFCVEPGRWTATSAKFGALNSTMAQPAVRAKAMGDKDQSQVWAAVRGAQSAASETVTPEASGELAQSSSYARLMQNAQVKQKVDSVAEPIQRTYQSLIKELRDRNAVGVVAAINGEIVWADIFASTSLLEKYWPKLVQSYAAEAFVHQSQES